MSEGGNGISWRHFANRVKARQRLRRRRADQDRRRRLQYVSRDQIAYAQVLDIGVTIGLILLTLTFALYVFGLLPPKVPLADMPSYWSMSSQAYTAHIGVGTGWGWVSTVGHGDYLNFIGIAFLASITVICYLRILPKALAHKERIFGAMLSLQVVVLLLAASGLLAVAH